MARIRLEGVTKVFGTVVAVDDLTLTIEDGEFFALLGPSGCGKTTTLRMVAGLERPTRGRIFIGERDVTDLPPQARDIAMVFQDYALYPHMTILENIGYPLKVRRYARSEIHRRVREVAEVLQIADLLDRRPGQLSGGQQQRAAVARALVYPPQAFLFDEPLSNLDAKLRLEARSFLKHLQKSLGITTIYVTHDQAEAMALADRIGVMDRGRLLQVGTPIEIYRRPRNTFVATFIGSPPMNLLRCRFQQAEAALILEDGQVLALGERAEAVREAFRNGETLWLGVRPEHLSLAEGPGPTHLAARVYAVEPLGVETLVTVQTDAQRIAMRLATEEPPVMQEQVWVHVPIARALFFRESGELAL
ncbi:ABC transporter ATP-binding protein [Thermoflexus sp.]|uniref:ABC transporter ATP-binding protein n=1 Tax=Thermoflexus sp. TaxID=1969742 RepID=UPI0035E4567C